MVLEVRSLSFSGITSQGLIPFVFLRGLIDFLPYECSSVNVLISSRDVIFSDNVVYFYNFSQIFGIFVYREIAFLVPA